MAPSGTDFRTMRDAIWSNRLPALHTLVALRMVEHMPHIAPSISSLAKHTRLSRDSVMRCIGDLEKWGCLLVTRRQGRRSEYLFTGSWHQLETSHQLLTAAGGAPPPVAASNAADSTQQPPPVATSNPKQISKAEKELDTSSSGAQPPDPGALDPAVGTPDCGAHVVSIFEHWQRTLGHPRSILDGKRKKLIRARLREFSPADLVKAIDGCSRSPFHTGKNPKTAGERYDGIELILRDAAHVEKFLILADQQGSLAGSSPFGGKRTWL
jgi:hypothetical protein